MKKKLFPIIIIVGLLLSACNIINVQLNPYTPTPEDIPDESKNPPATEVVYHSEYPNQWSASDDGIIDDPYAPELGNDGYDIKHYDISISLSPIKLYEILDASVNITLQTTQELSTIPLDFIGYEISNISLVESSTQLEYERKNDKLFINLPELTPPDTSITIQIDYAGKATIEPSRFIDFAPSVGFFYPDSEHMFIASEPDGARYWLPCNDHPQDKATYSFTITTPEENRGIANGKLVEEIKNNDGTNTYKYEHKDPMASYLTTIIVGDFEYMFQEEIDGVQINVFAPSRYAGKVQLFEDDLIESFQWMSEKFGPYPFESLGYVIIDATGFSLETQTMILMDDQMLDLQTLVHEISHMWFGDSVSLASWHEIWRNEGFATFVHTYYPIRDRSQTTIENTFEGIREWMDEENKDFDLDSPPEGDLFHVAEYYKASVVVYDLFNLMGEEAFYSGLQTYFAKYQGGTATDEDFWLVMEESSGLELDDFIENQFME